MRWKNDVLIEDLRNHSSDVVESLREVLADGACMIPDTKRPGFYEIESDTHVYYVHIQESTGKVMLLATWPSPRVLDEVHSSPKTQCVAPAAAHPIAHAPVDIRTPDRSP